MANNRNDPPKSHPTELSARVNAALNHAGVGVAGLRNKAGSMGYTIHDSTIYKMMNGLVKDPRPERLWIVAQAAGVRMEDLDPRYKTARNTLWPTLLEVQALQSLTGEEMADKLGIHPRTYALLVRGGGAQTYTIHKIRRALGLPAEMPPVAPPPLPDAESSFDEMIAAAEQVFGSPETVPAAAPEAAPDQPLRAPAPASLAGKTNEKLQARAEAISDLAPAPTRPQELWVREPEPEAPAAPPNTEEVLALLNWTLVQTLSAALSAHDTPDHRDHPEWQISQLLSEVLVEVVQYGGSPQIKDLLHGLEILTDPQANIKEHSYMLLRLMLTSRTNQDLTATEVDMVSAFEQSLAQRKELL